MNKTLINSRHRIMHNGSAITYDVYEVDIVELTFNKFNGRYRSEAIDTKGSVEKLEELTDEQIFGYLENDRPGSYEKTYESIKEHGIIQPLVITGTGIVLDGNSRLYCLKKLQRNNELKSNKVPVVIIEGESWDRDNIEAIETELQFLASSKIEYTPINRKIKLAQLFEKYEDEFKSKEKAYEKTAEIFGYTKSYVKSEIEVIYYIQKFFEKHSFDKFKYSWFNQSNDQITKLSSFFEALDKKDIKWLDDEIRNRLEKVTLVHALFQVKAVGLFRELFTFKSNNILSKKEICLKWLDETEALVGQYNILFEKELWADYDGTIKKYKTKLSNISQVALDEIRRIGYIEAVSENEKKTAPTSSQSKETVQSELKVSKASQEKKPKKYNDVEFALFAFEMTKDSLENYLQSNDTSNDKLDELIKLIENYRK